MLTLLVALLVAVGPLLRGSWDLWAQTALFIAVGSGTALWLASRIFLGYVPLPSSRVLAWSGVLAALAGLSASLSPVPAYAVPAWRPLLLGLWVFPALSAISKDGRARIDEAVRAAAWALALLAVYQHVHDGVARPPSAFLNQNVFAGAILLFLPLAASRSDWLLAGLLLLSLWWTKSVGAWLALGATLMLAARRSGGAGWRVGAALAAICLAILYARSGAAQAAHRWHWWTAAWRMVHARPLLGFGPGAYAYAMPAYEPTGRDLSSLFAHQHFLETAAECGLPYLLLWAAGLAHYLNHGGEHKRFGATAVLVQSLWDFTLSIPGTFWLFCYFAASSSSETSRGANVRAARKPWLIGAVLAGAWLVGAWAWRRWDADRLRAAAYERVASGAAPAEGLALLARAAELAADPEADRLAAELELARVARGEGPPEPGVRAALSRLERAAALNPYRASTWVALERLYRQLGDPARSASARRRGAVYCPGLRGNES